MAAVRSKRPWRWKDILSNTTWFSVVLCFITSTLINSDALNYIVFKEKLGEGTGCTDGTGAERTHLDEWSTASGSCDRYICFHGVAANFVISHTCQELGVNENPDTTNCEETADTAQAFPGCCPVLECSDREPVVAPTFPACYDISSNYSCTIWNVLGGCSSTSNLYNFTSEFCQLTCGFC
ncbi:unnamed protein product [Owenia fusiformis]|uniref:ShKT domain-containing protein n=1 Tax=Owenia fusiformis TaxID=6347 RepID=A0A8S4N3L7_OWEFU|nr:unnamed protein product [Owenia fusiformis]